MKWSRQLAQSVLQLDNEPHLATRSLRDVLNAAWHCRLYGEPGWSSRINAAANGLCKSIMGARRDSDVLVRHTGSPTASSSKSS